MNAFCTHALIGRVLYGTGMRLLECLRLRVKDVDFGLNQITIREGKGAKDRSTVLPALVVLAVHEQLAAEWGWQYVFPSPRHRTVWAAQSHRCYRGARRGRTSRCG